MVDDLHTPLGQKTKREGGSAIAGVGKYALFALFAAGIGAGGWALFSQQRQAAEPSETIAIDESVAKTTQKSEERVAVNLDDANLRESKKSDEQVLTTSDPSKPARLEEIKPSGYLTEVVRTDNDALSTGPLSDRPDPQLTQKSDYGMLPRRSEDGRRPFEVYAKPTFQSFGRPRIAFVVGGLGISQTGSQQAIEKLPDNVTLGFAASGNSLKRWMKKAREGGHEVVLQVPMEPLGYPQINPGPRTLLTGGTHKANIEHLRWAMGRMTNYVGVMNYLGAEFTANKDAMRPVMTELATRGLMFIDDGTSGRSLSESVAGEERVPYARASVLLDGQQRVQDIDKNLDILEALARKNGRAIGVASAFPVSVERINKFIERAEKRNLAIVPLSDVAVDPEKR